MSKINKITNFKSQQTQRFPLSGTGMSTLTKQPWQVPENSLQ